MRYLYLIRHAKSSWSDLELNDFDRDLNKRGKRDAPFMGEVLKKMEIEPDLILSSPAKRAKKTAIKIAKELSYLKEKIVFKEELYEAPTKNLEYEVKNIDNRVEHLFLVAHNPSLNMFAEFLLNEHYENLVTCSVLALELNIDSWSELERGVAKELFFEYPKKYFPKES